MKFSWLYCVTTRFSYLLFRNYSSKCKAQKHYYKTITWKMHLFTSFALIWPSKVSHEITKDDEIKSFLENADSLFENGQYEKCYNILKSYKNPQHVEVQWRICRVLYNISKQPKISKEEKKAMILEAYQIISDQLSKDSNNYAVHKWYALLLDAKSTYDGITERIKQLETVKRHMDVAVTLNPNDATTLHILGEFCYQITEMPWYQRKIAETIFAAPPNSTYEDALEYFLRAEFVEPRFYSVNLLRLGNCYLKLNKKDQAIYYLTLAASYPAKSNDDHQANKEAAELLKKFK